MNEISCLVGQVSQMLVHNNNEGRAQKAQKGSEITQSKLRTDIILFPRSYAWVFRIYARLVVININWIRKNQISVQHKS